MLTSRRNFIKKTAIVGAGAVASTTVLAATGNSSVEDETNGVVKGKSPKKEILYKKTAAWEEFYKGAK